MATVSQSKNLKSETAVVKSRTAFTNERPLVTFALFAYNQEQYIREAVEGALSQTYTPLEIILSDDCSSDGTFKIMEELVAAYSGSHRIIVNKNRNNRGVSDHVAIIGGMAKGNLIIIAAGDDISMPKRTEVLVAKWMEAGKPSAIFSDTIPIDTLGIELEKQNDHPKFTHIDRSDPQFKLQVEKNYYQLSGASSAYARCDIFDEFKPLESGLPNEDQPLSFRALLKNGIAYESSKLVKYRQHDKNLFNLARSEDKVCDIAKRRCEHKKMFADKIKIMECYINDIEFMRTKNDIPQPIEEVLNILSNRVKVLKLLVSWRDHSFVWRCWMLVSCILHSGNESEKLWARRNLFH